LSRENVVTVEPDARRALKLALGEPFDVALISLDLSSFDSLRLYAKLRSSDRARMLPILVKVESEADSRLIRALDLGVNDYLLRPVERNELKARVRTQLLRKRYADHLRDNTKLMLEMATIDGLTQLTNRRRFEDQFAGLVAQSLKAGRPVSMLIIDIDHFKSVNDTYGHLADDKVLVEFGRRLRGAVRDVDLASRFGGEEFVVAMPETDRATGYRIAERLREILLTDPFRIDESVDPISVTVSVGVSALTGPEDTPGDLMARADAPLYRAKRHGRNRVAEAAA
jgi:two-component system cell cycle response regulator